MLLSYKTITPPIVEPVTLAQAKQQLRVDFTDDDTLISTYIVAARQYCEKFTNRAFFNQTVQLNLDHFPLPKFSTTLTPEARRDWPFFGSAWDYFSIRLPRPRALSVESVKYLDLSSNLQTLQPCVYYVDVTSEPARLVPQNNLFWPYTQQYLPGSITVTYTVGSYVQDVTETFTVPTTAPYTYTPLQGPVTAIASVFDSDAATPAYSFQNGSLTFQAASAGLSYTLDYYVGAIPQTIAMAILLLVSHWYEQRSNSTALNLKNIPLGVEALLEGETFHGFYFDSGN